MKSHEIKPRLAMSKILPLERAYEVVEGLKRQGKCVVFTNGCFDLLHLGHTRYLAAASDLGDLLIVAINSDPSVRALKGPGRPIIPQDERAETLAALEAVDYVTIFDNPTVQPVIARMLPHVLVKGAGWAPNEIVGRAEVEAAGGRVVSMSAAADISSTDIINAAPRSTAKNLQF
jgi:D-glycero-beta-D-manno-heptose 1-phosphate adenylyltransferase